MSRPSPANAQVQIDPKMLEAMQGPLIDLAQKSGGDLRKLLFAFFDFLSERTDFYCIPHEEDVGTMGFREGDAEKLLLAAFRQFPLRKLPKRKVTPTTTKVVRMEPPVTTNVLTTLPEKKSEPQSGEEVPRLTDEGLQIPVGNGGTTARYRWTQSLEEASLVIAVPEGTRGKDIDLNIKASSVSVKIKNTRTPLLEGDLIERVQKDESTWTLEGGCLLLVLHKQKKTWWSTVIKGDPTIDTTLVDSTRRIDSYDEITQANIRRILFDQRQERLGLKTSDMIMREKGEKPIVPPLPVGVEYIDKDTLDDFTASPKT